MAIAGTTIVVSPDPSAEGAQRTFSGSGYVAGEVVIVNAEGGVQHNGRANMYGSFSWASPYLPPDGSYTASTYVFRPKKGKGGGNQTVLAAKTTYTITAA